MKKHVAMFPIMAQWLSPDEGARLLREFEGGGRPVHRKLTTSPPSNAKNLQELKTPNDLETRPGADPHRRRGETNSSKGVVIRSEARR